MEQREDSPGPRYPVGVSRKPALSRDWSNAARARYPDWSDSNDRHAVVFGDHGGRLAAIASATRVHRLELALGSDSGFQDWPDPFSSDATTAVDGDGGSSTQLRLSFQVGSRVATRLGGYEVLGVLGEGRYARVYRGYDPILERAVALKVHRPGVWPFDEMKERFLGEARALARVRHPAIVPVYELGRDNDQCVIVMALIEGHSLAEQNRQGSQSIDFRRAAEIIADLAEAVDHAHGQGILHRDIKPANILVDESGSVYLTDFGLATGRTRENSPRLRRR